MSSPRETADAIPPSEAIRLLLASSLLTLLVVVIAAGGMSLAYGLVHRDHIYPGVVVQGRPLGGFTWEAAQRELLAAADTWSSQKITLRAGQKTWTVTTADLGLRYDVDATLAAAYAVGRCFNLLEDMRQRLAARLSGFPMGMVSSVDKVATLTLLNRLAREIDSPMQNASLAIENMRVVATPSRVGRRLDLDASMARIMNALSSIPAGNVTPIEVPLVVSEVQPLVGDEGLAEAKATVERMLASPIAVGFTDTQWVIKGKTAVQQSTPRSWTLERSQIADAIVIQQRKEANGQVILVPTVDADRLAGFVKGIAKDVNQTPVDARFDRDSATGVLSPKSVSRDGRTVDVNETARRLAAAVVAGERSVPLVVAITQPAVSVDMMDKLGIKELVAQPGVSYFSGSSSQRSHNIRLAASKLDGVVIPPGAVFSFNDALGPITEEEGYQEGYAIKGDFTVKDIGGGVCQVATTFFRAIFWAGYPVLERNQHRYRLHYYELKGFPVGLDAAIYQPGRDLKFKNNTDSYILVQSVVDPANAELRFEFYGTKVPWTVRMEPPIVKPGAPHGPPLPDEEDPDLPKGVRKLIQPAVDGLEVTITRTVLQNGKILRTDTFKTVYQPARELYVVGTKTR